MVISKEQAIAQFKALRKAASDAADKHNDAMDAATKSAKVHSAIVAVEQESGEFYQKQATIRDTFLKWVVSHFNLSKDEAKALEQA